MSSPSLFSGLLTRLTPSSSSSLLSPSVPTLLSRCHRALWRYDDIKDKTAWPDKKPFYAHRKHYFPPHTYGVHKTTQLRCVDNSKIGREAMAEGRPPKVFQVYAAKHSRKPHGAFGKLGDRVYCAVKGEKIHGIVVGVRNNQLAGIPRFDSNNVVLIEPNGNPLGTRIHVPIPNCIRPILKRKSNSKIADYTKLLAIATKFV